MVKFISSVEFFTVRHKKSFDPDQNPCPLIPTPFQSNPRTPPPSQPLSSTVCTEISIVYCFKTDIYDLNFLSLPFHLRSADNVGRPLCYSNVFLFLPSALHDFSSIYHPIFLKFGQMIDNDKFEGRPSGRVSLQVKF